MQRHRVGLDVWRALVQAQRDGRARDIGVSNYPVDALDRLADATGVRPAVNQVRWSPLVFDAAVLDGHRARGVVLEGHSGLRRGALDHRVVTAARLPATLRVTFLRPAAVFRCRFVTLNVEGQSSTE